MKNATMLKDRSITEIFMHHSAKVYAGIRGRHTAKYSKRGKLVQPAIPVPYTLDEFRYWVASEWFDFKPAPIHCYYCREWIDAGSFTVDHKMAWRTSKDSRFPNLVLCCKSCNLAKGDFTEYFFKSL